MYQEDGNLHTQGKFHCVPEKENKNSRNHYPPFLDLRCAFLFVLSNPFQVLFCFSVCFNSMASLSEAHPYSTCVKTVKPPIPGNHLNRKKRNVFENVPKKNDGAELFLFETCMVARKMFSYARSE